MLAWIAIVGLASLFIKLRGSSMRGLDTGGRWAGTGAGDGMHSGGGG